MTADRVFGILFALVGVGMFYMTQQVAQPFADSGDPGPRLMPDILSVAMIVLGATLSLRRAPDATSQVVPVAPSASDGPTTMLAPPALPRRLGIAACFIAFLALFEPLGFTVSSFLFLAASMSLMDDLTLSRIVARTIAAAVVVLAVGLLLGRLLQLPVPGIWFV